MYRRLLISLTAFLHATAAFASTPTTATYIRERRALQPVVRAAWFDEKEWADSCADLVDGIVLRNDGHHPYVVLWGTANITDISTVAIAGDLPVNICEVYYD